jgi:hypothetical protein
MGLKEVLSKMKIVELETPPAPAGPAARTAAVPQTPQTPQTSRPARPNPPVDVREILGTLPAPPQIDEKALPRPTAGEAIPDFDAIYRAAGISDPPHGYTAERVLEILSSDGFTGLDPKARAAALAGFLKMNPSGPVPIADVIQDAVRRDQALDKFEELLRGKLAARAAEVERQNAALQAEIDELARRNREKMEANRQTLEAEQLRLGQWQARKRIEERRLFAAVAPFVEENPVSTEEAHRAAAGPEPDPTSGPAGEAPERTANR